MPPEDLSVLQAPSSTKSASSSLVARLRRFVKPVGVASCCELCGAVVPETHSHLVDLRADAIVCCCRTCAVLFGAREEARYRRVPEESARLPAFALRSEHWEALGIPVAVAFFYASTREGWVACYPGPAGATRSMLDLHAWDQVLSANLSLRSLRPDVEAVLVRRTREACEAFRVPIDRCYALVGLLRQHWHGVTGGEPARAALEHFFRDLRHA
jgi:hypothetical protein